MPVELTYAILQPGTEPPGVPNLAASQMQSVQVTATDSDSGESAIFSWYYIQKMPTGQWRRAQGYYHIPNPGFDNTGMENEWNEINNSAKDYIEDFIVPHLAHAPYPLPPDFIQYLIENPQGGRLLPRAHPLAELHLFFNG